MNEGAPMMYGGGGCGYGGAGVFVMAGQERPSRHYPLDVLQVLGGAAPSPANTRRAPRKERPPRDPRDATAFGYDSDDSSLSSNASGSNKSSEKGMSTLIILLNANNSFELISYIAMYGR